MSEMSEERREGKVVLPGHETQATEMNCPSCGRFVGAKNKCPYCGARVTKRMSLVAIRWAAVLLATVGMGCLWMMARYKTLPVVKIGDLQPTMNFAQIKIEGAADSDARTFRNGGMGFHISDGTGSLMVFISQKQAAELKRLGRIPRAGDKVVMCGTVSLSDKDASIRLQSAEGLVLERAPAKLMKLGDIDADLKGESLTVQGQITDFSTPPAGSKKPYTLKLRDGTGERTITFWQTEYDQIREKDELMGAYARMRVSVASYRGKLQLKLTDGMSLELLPAEEIGAMDAAGAAAGAAAAAVVGAPAVPAGVPVVETKRGVGVGVVARDFSRGRTHGPVYQEIAAINKGMKGQTVRVKGRVSSVKEPGEGSLRPTEVVLYGEDGKRPLTVKYWAKTAEVIETPPKPGYLFDIKGEVDVYKGRVSLKVGSGYNIKLISDVPPSGPAVDISAAEPVAGVTADRAGEVVVVVGRLGADSPLRGGVKFPLTDAGGGVIDVVMWEGMIPAELREGLEEGMKVAVRGHVKPYGEEVNVVAEAGYSVMRIEE